MIWDSEPWKTSLQKTAASLRRRRTQSRWTAQSFTKVEQDLMLGFYTIRKLREAGKLSDELATRKLKCMHFPNRKSVTKLNWHKIDELYDLSRNSPRRCSIKYICDQFIHSYVFCLVQGEDGGLDHVLFVSDFDRNKFIKGLSIESIANFFDGVSTDNRSSMRMWDADLDDFNIST